MIRTYCPCIAAEAMAAYQTFKELAPGRTGSYQSKPGIGMLTASDLEAVVSWTQDYKAAHAIGWWTATLDEIVILLRNLPLTYEAFTEVVEMVQYIVQVPHRDPPFLHIPVRC